MFIPRISKNSLLCNNKTKTDYQTQMLDRFVNSLRQKQFLSHLLLQKILRKSRTFSKAFKSNTLIDMFKKRKEKLFYNRKKICYTIMAKNKNADNKNFD